MTAIEMATLMHDLELSCKATKPEQGELPKKLSFNRTPSV